MRYRGLVQGPFWQWFNVWERVTELRDLLASVIILNYNGKRFLEDCLASLQRQTCANYQVILVDNASTDGSVEFVQENFAFVKIVENERNEYSAGNNRGIQAARGKYIVILNNDTKVDDCWLENLVEAAEADSRVGMCASKVLSMENPQVIDSAGLVIYPDGMSRARGRLEQDVGQYDQIEEILLPSGCAALYRREMLDDIGLFDQDFVAYCEDTDLGLRGRLAGWKAVYVPLAVAYHHYSGSWKSYSPMKAFLVERNHFWVVVKNLPRRMLFKVPIYTLGRYLVQIYGVLVGKGAGGRFEGSKFELLLILARAYWGALKRLPLMLRKRKAIQAAKKVSDSEIAEWFGRYHMSVVELVLTD